MFESTGFASKFFSAIYRHPTIPVKRYNHCLKVQVVFASKFFSAIYRHPTIPVKRYNHCLKVQVFIRFKTLL